MHHFGACISDFLDQNVSDAWIPSFSSDPPWISEACQTVHGCGVITDFCLLKLSENTSKINKIHHGNQRTRSQNANSPKK